jgi:hypothetical protein
VVAALIVAEAKYNAAFSVSVVGAVKLPRETIVEAPSWCWANISSPRNEVAIDCVFAMMVPFLGYAQFTFFT